MDIAAFVLLGLAVVAVWVPPVAVKQKAWPVWPALLAAAAVAGVVYGVLSPAAWLSLAVLTGLCWSSQRAQGAWRSTLTALAALLALTMSLHKLPGFHNPTLYVGARFTPDAVPFTSYVNFDKGAAGLLLLAFFARRSHRWTDATRAALRAAPWAALTIAVTLGTAWAIGLLRPAPKLPPWAAVFLASNLLFTCVAEESFFRGLIQERLARVRRFGRAAPWVAAAASALLFGAAHAGGGLAYVSVATLAGLGYAAVYARTRAIEPAIVTHFAVNTIHFVAFTYPALAR